MTLEIIKSGQITYGQDYSSEVGEFLDGEKITFNTRCIDTSIYAKPHYKAYFLPSGRVVKITDKIASSILELYGSVEDYERAKAAYWSGFADPEAGKVRV